MAKKKSPMPAPVGNKIMVIRDKVGDKLSDGGIVMPESVQEKPLTASVISVNKGDCWVDGVKIPANPFGLVTGDQVIINLFSGTDFKYGNEIYTFVHPDEIVGIVE